MNERQPLSYLLAAADLATTEPVVPFPAQHGEEPVIVTAVLERTAVFSSSTDRYETRAVKHLEILVDPAMMEWKPRAQPPAWEAPGRIPGSSWNGAWRPRTEDQNVETRKKTDERALESQAKVAPTSPVLLKFCPSCKKEKLKSEFPPGGGYFACNECRAKVPTIDDARLTPWQRTHRRNLELAEQGRKICGSCKRELSIEAFNKNKSKPGGYQSICRECISGQWTLGSTLGRRAKEAPDGLLGTIIVEQSSAPPELLPAPTITTVNGGHQDLLERLRSLRAERDQALLERDEARAELGRIVADLEAALA